MRSTAGSQIEPSFAAKNGEKSEQHEKIEKAKLASNTRSRTPQSPPTLPDLPPALAAQLVTVTSPRDLLSAHVASNDRRLRRLLCRYTNQIQYGCKNPYCIVPSCLTCRRRKAKTPLRKYTDATARALASHIIEEHGEKGLCHSDPVVPWFETPGSRPKTDHTEAKPKANGHVKESANGHFIGPANGHTISHYRKTLPNKPSTKVFERHHSEDTAKSNDSAERRIPSEENHYNGACSGSEQSSCEKQPGPLERRDTKSFTQAVFDSLSLRSLWSTSHARSDHIATSPILRTESDAVEHRHVDSTGSALAAQDDNREAAQQMPTRDSDDFRHPPENEEPESAPLDTLVDSAGTMIDANTSLKSKTIEDEHDELQVQVAPFLTIDFLVFFERWQLLKLHQHPIPWSEQWLPEPDAEFIHNSVFFCLRDSTRTLKSIREWHGSHNKREMYDSNEFSRVAIRQGVLRIASIIPLAETFRALRLGLADGYNPPKGWSATMNQNKHQYHVQQDCNTDEEIKLSGDDKHLSDEDAARLCTFGLLLLEGGCAALKPPTLTGVQSGKIMKLPLEFVQKCNSSAKVFQAHLLCYVKDPTIPEALRDPSHEAPTYRDIVGQITNFIEYFDDYDANRLFLRITDLVAARYALDEMRKSRRKKSLSLKEKPTVAALIASHLMSYDRQSRGETANSISMDATLLTIEWTRLLFAREWDGNAVIRRASSLGGSLQLLMAMFTESRKIALHPAHFYCPLIADRLNMVEMPAEWLSFRADTKAVHLLSFPFLFEPNVLVTCFRAINYSRMSNASVDARAVQKDVRELTDSNRCPGTNNNTSLLTSLQPHMANNFVMTVRRANLLEDAMDQVWRRQRRELMRPLKVRMGMDEGEQGLDLGGVQQEFFRLLFAQALNPEYAMFSIDDRTRMTWFQPGSLEPLYKFEVLGIFMSIAVYNSITLPVTFPLALYRKLLGLKVKKIHQIDDGWPELAKGLRQMLDWSDGDVSAVFARTYEFSYEAFGKHVNIDMKKFDKHTTWPPGERKKKEKTASFELPPDLETERPPSSMSLSRDCVDDEAPLVTNADREQYVKDYIIWLTHRSVEQQYEAFAKGFYTCLSRTALSIFTPEALKVVIEGYTDIDISGLEAVAKYEDGFDEFSSTIQDFWQVVRNFSTDQHRRLLEFVTASDRVPVNGISSVQFIIQRNGSGDERLPTSMTCFGRLLLPQYSSRQVLEEKLTKAIENSEGFGVA